MRQVAYFSVLLLALLFVSCCRDDDDSVELAWKVGVYHDAIHGEKYLTLEFLPSRGTIQAVEFASTWVFTNGVATITREFSNEAFVFSSTSNQVQGIGTVSVTSILNDSKWWLKEIEIRGRVKVSGCWCNFSGRRQY